MTTLIKFIGITLFVMIMLAGSVSAAGYVIYDDPSIPITISTAASTDMIGYYGECWGDEIGETPLPVIGEHYNVTNMTLGLRNGFTTSGDALVAEFSGVYQVTSNFAFTGTASKEYHLGLGLNGIPDLSCHTQRKMGGANDVGSAGYTCLISINASDHITSMVANEDGSQPVNIHDINLNLVRISD